MMPAAPSSTAAGPGLQQIGPRARIAKAADAIAEGCLLPRHIKVLHEGKVVFVQLRDRPACAGDDDQDIGGLGVAIGGVPLRSLDADG